MSEPVRVVITMEGGLISAVCTLGVPIEALIIDYDTEGAGADDIETIDQANNREADALVRFEVAEPLDPAIMASVERFWPEKPMEPRAFERAKLAGYAVHQTDTWTKPDGSEGGRWAYDAPDGAGCGVGYATERAAWEAADRHRMFGGADD